MPIRTEKRACYLYQLRFPVDEAPELVQRHVAQYPSTLEVETQGAKLIAGGFQEDQVVSFVKRVCNWGGYSGIAGRVVRYQRPDRIATVLSEAFSMSSAGKVAEGVEWIAGLNGLGWSFASKHLRFLDPDRAVVLDSVISRKLGYDLDAEGYRLLLEDCKAIKAILESAKIENPIRISGDWRVSDVEMAIFAKLRGF